MNATAILTADLAREIAEYAFGQAAEVYFTTIADDPRVTPEAIEDLTDQVVEQTSALISRALIGRGWAPDLSAAAIYDGLVAFDRRISALIASAAPPAGGMS